MQTLDRLINANSTKLDSKSKQNRSKSDAYHFIVPPCNAFVNYFCVCMPYRCFLKGNLITRIPTKQGSEVLNGARRSSRLITICRKQV